MTMRTTFMERFALKHPIVQAPMAGGGDTPQLIAAVCDAGGIGFLGAGYLTPAQIADAASAVRARTSRPFGINLFAPLPASTSTAPINPAAALARLEPYYRELGIALPGAPSAGNRFDEQLAVVLQSGASAFSFTF